MTNKSRGDYAYTMVDVDQAPPASAVEHIRSLEGVLRVRLLEK